MTKRDGELSGGAATGRTRALVARGFTMIEDIVYVGLGFLLAASAVVLLGSSIVSFSRDLMTLTLPGAIIGVLDRLLLVLVIIELLYTVQISFREHALVPEPFLVVSLIAATRRILVLTAAFAGMPDRSDAAFRVEMIELSLLTVMIVALVGSLLMLRSGRSGVVATRA